MNRYTALARTLLASAAIASAIALSGCETDGTTPSIPARAMKPLPQEMLAELERKSMPKESPILLRIFKEEAELEVWKQDASGRYAHLKTYPICRWSGELGPKFKEGDRQAPEGFYAIAPGQLNPNSSYYLSFNLGYPNAFDKAHDRTGSHLMVHGDCSSRGCYAMTDDQIGEIYALGRESFFGGQKAFQVQAYPFRMTPLNMAKHRNSPHMPFWRMIKEGHDHFEVTRQEPKVDVCEKRYVFDATAPGGADTPLNFSPKGRCPAYEIPTDIAAAVTEKRERDEQEFASLVSRGIATVAVKTGADGGMHSTFLAKLRPPEIFDGDGRVRALASTSATPALPATVNPPRTPEPVVAVAANGSVPRTATRTDAQPAPTRLASAESAQPGRPAQGGMFGNLFASNGDQAKANDNPLDRVGSTVSKWLGLRSSEATEAPPPAPKPRPAAEPKQTSAPKVAPGAIRPQPAPQPRPQVAETAEPQAAPAMTASIAPANPAASASLMPGAQPVVPTGSFESRWSAWR